MEKNEKKKEFIDIITDDVDFEVPEIIVKEKVVKNETVEEILTLDDRQVTINEGVIRDKKTGRWVKGTPNPSQGRPKKMKSLEKLIERKTGPECERLVQKLVGIALYDPDEPEIHYDKVTGNSTVKKKLFHFYSANTQMQALQLLMAYYFGRPSEKLQVDQNVNVNIEKKVGIITKLITENKDRLKLVDGGKE